jgi:hypothetical protein
MPQITEAGNAYELANTESQPSVAFGTNNPMEKTLIKHFMNSNAPGQYDSQMSLQLYGNTQGNFTTQASTVPT